eukprot:8536180-Alexandrium_andersonii.AAC.1
MHGRSARERTSATLSKLRSMMCRLAGCPIDAAVPGHRSDLAPPAVEAGRDAVADADAHDLGVRDVLAVAVLVLAPVELALNPRAPRL